VPKGLSEILPDSLFFPNQKPAVIRALQQQPAPPNTRRDWFFLWALWVGSKINARDYAEVKRGAVDA
jgi:hypothetical protein